MPHRLPNLASSLALVAVTCLPAIHMACANSVDPPGTTSGVAVSSGSSGGEGGAGGAASNVVSVAHGGCYDAYACGELYDNGGCMWCESDSCPSELAACDGDPYCAALGDCVAICAGNHACIDDCRGVNADGVALFDALAACTACFDSCLSFDCPTVHYPAITCAP